MKKVLFSLVLCSAFSFANAQIQMPQPSPTQTVKQDFGLSSIELSYSRPAVKGRKVFGDLVPFNAVWRTGANGATTLTFGDDVVIGGVEVPAGKYGLLSIPGATSWTLIISGQTDVTSPAAYNKAQDIVRVVSKVKPLSSKEENFTIQFDNIQSESCDLVISWDRSMVNLPIKTNVDAKIMAAIDKSMQSEKPAYFQAAFYYLENGKDLKMAEEWFEKAVAIQPNAFWIRYQQARNLSKLGKKAAAKEAALKSKELAMAAKNQDYVTLNNKFINTLK